MLSAASVEGLEFTAAVVARLTERDEMEVEERLRTLQAAHRLVEPIGDPALIDIDGESPGRIPATVEIFHKVLPVRC